MKNTLLYLYFKVLAVALVFMGQFANSQVTIAADGLNNTATLFSVSGGAFYTGNSAGSGTDVPFSSPFASEGTHSYGVSNGTATITSNSNINTSGYSSVTMSMRLASFSVGSTGNGADSNDIVTIAVSPDGGTTYYNTVRVLGNINTTWAYSTGTGNATTSYDGNVTPITFAPTGSGAQTTSGYSNVKITNLPAVSNLRFKITLLNNAIAERWVIDDFKVTGTLAGPTLTATPTTLTGMTYVAGSGPSNIKNFVLTGANLNGTQNVTVLPGNNWEVSIDQATWSTYNTPLVLTNYNGASTTVSVRLKAGLPVATYNNASNDILVLQGYGITPSSTLTLSGTVTAPLPKPIITEDIIEGTVGTPLSFQVQASNSPTSFALANGATLPAGLTLSTTGLISGTPTTFVDEFSTFITATNGTGTSDPAEFLLAIEKANQTIIFTTPPSKIYGDADFTLTASTTSGLGISFESSDTSIATVSGNTVTIVGVGTTNITATQIGDANYNAAAPITQQFIVTAKAVTVQGVTANDKVEDGTTTASLSGIPSLTGVLATDVADVTVEGVPVANFATATVGTGIAVNVSGYILTGSKAANYVITQPTGLTASITALGTPLATAATIEGSTSFMANWAAVANASSYLLDVSTSATFGTASSGTVTEGFESTTFPPTGWVADSWTRSTSAGNINSGSGAAIAGSATGLLTTTSVANPTSMSFYLGRSSNTTAKTLTIEISTTSQTSGFSTLDTFNHGNVPVSTYDQYTVDLSAYSAEPVVYIRFNKTSGTTSPWRLDDIVINYGTSIPDYVTGYENLNVGDVTSHLVSGLDPLTTYFYRVRAVSGTVTSPNSNIIEVTTIDINPFVIWDGTEWSNTTGPDAATDAFIEGPYSTFTSGIFTAKSLTIRESGSLSIDSLATITVVEALNNTLTAAAVVVKNNGNLIQGGTNNMNTGEITVQRNSSALMRQDYTLWSSPTSGAQTLLDFSPATLSTRFYTYNATNDLYETVTPATTTFATADAYLIRMPNNHPTTATLWEGSFVGTPNSGNISATLVANTTPEVTSSFNAVGNPYPSPIDAVAFTENANNLLSTTGTLYFWRKTNNAGSPSYSTWNSTGFTSNGEEQVVNPNGVIQTGQGFIVEGGGTGTVDFTNSMRVNNHADQFFKTSRIVERHRIWLNATNADGLFTQTLVGYVTDASNELDRADGKYMNDGPIALTSIVSDTPLTIQGRSLPFQTTDVVALQFKAKDAGTYTIAIDHVDGLFEGSQDVFLKDIQTGSITNLSEGSYSFTAPAGVSAGRFQIVYKNDIVLGTGAAAKDQLIVYRDGNNFVVQSKTRKLLALELYDASGRLVYQAKPNTNEAIIDASTLSNGIYILKLNEEGKIVTKKLVK